MNNVIITSNMKRGAWGTVSKSKNQAPSQVKNTITKQIINSSKKPTAIASNGLLDDMQINLNLLLYY